MKLNLVMAPTSNAKSRTSSTKKADIEVITRPPGSRKVNSKCGNINCSARRADIPLKLCARCKTIMYCSREYLTTMLVYPKSFRDHKGWCNNDVDHLAELAEADKQGLGKELPDNMSLVELDQKLEKWVKFHNSLLMAATIHALSLPRDLRRSQTYVLGVRVSYRTDNNGVTAKFFRVDDAYLIEVQDARKKGNIWVQSLDEIERLRTESESRRMGTVAAIALECEPLAMQIVPFGSLRDLSPLRIQAAWKEILIRNVQNGKRFI